MYAAFAHPDLRSYLEKGRQSPMNIYRGLKRDWCQAALSRHLLLSFQTWADLSLIGFSTMTSDEVFQNHRWTKSFSIGVKNAGSGPRLLSPRQLRDLRQVIPPAGASVSPLNKGDSKRVVSIRGWLCINCLEQWLADSESLIMLLLLLFGHIIVVSKNPVVTQKITDRKFNKIIKMYYFKKEEYMQSNL